MNTIDAERWQTIQGVLDRAFDLPAEARPAFLDRACGPDGRLREDVDSLLAADEESGDILDTPAGMLLDSVAREHQRSESAGAALGASSSLLGRSEPLAALDRALVERMHDRMQERHYESGQTILRQGDPGDSLMILVEGTAGVRVRSPDGKTHAIRRLEPMDVFGEMSLLTGEPRNAEVVADTSVRVLVLMAKDFHRLARRSPELAAVLTELLAARLGRSIHDGLGGMTVGGYRIRHCIGRGGMAVVYLAEHLASGKTVALKMMNHRLTYEPRALARFRREAEVLRSLRHDHVVTTYDEFSAYNTQFLVLEHCDGPNLDAIVRHHGKLAEDRVRRLAGQMARALEFVHAQGVVHRDLKPGNVLLNREGHVKLTDFGLAKPGLTLDGEKITQGIALIGTPAYLAPEQFTGAALDPRADVYSLGCLVYELLEGRPPFSGRDPFELLERKRRFRIPVPDLLGGGVSEAMHRFLDSALRPTPGERPASLGEITPWAAPVPEIWLDRNPAAGSNPPS